MKELEDTKAEARRAIDLQFSIWDRLNSSAEEDGGSPVGSPGYNGCASPLGDFFGDSAYAWLSSGPRLVVINVKAGTSMSSWTFRERVTCVSPFPAQPGQVPLLLVGLDNGASKMRDSSGCLCIFDCTISQILRAIRMPAGVERVCVIKSGAKDEDFGEERVDRFLIEHNGLACVALRNLDHLLIDLRRSSWEGPEATPIADESSPAELDLFIRNGSAPMRHNRYGRELHVAFNLMDERLEEEIDFSRDEFESASFNQHPLTSSLIYSRKIGCIVSGCRGQIIIWQMDGVVRLVSSPFEENPENYRFSINNIALLEPSDDPRPYCYLWASYQEETSRRPAFLQMYSMVFEQKYSDKGTNAYFNLKGDPSLKFEFELDVGDAVVNIHPINRESNGDQTESGIKSGEENLLLVSLDSRTLLFDVNQWYKEQWPHTIGDCQNPNVLVASYRTSADFQTLGDNAIVSCSYVPSSLKDFPRHGSSPPEEFFYPNSLSLEWVELGSSRLTFWMTRGVQGELLREISQAGPVLFLEPSETINRCLSAGLIPSNAKGTFDSDKDLQREALLSLCLEQRWSKFLLQCANEWSDGSASFLFHTFGRWVTRRIAWIKDAACDYFNPLFDQWDSSTIGEAEIKTLRFFAQQLECMSSVVTNLSIDSIDLAKERRSLRRLTTYFQVLLWFYDVGLLPETQKIDDETISQLALSLRIPYPFERLAAMYEEKRASSSAQRGRTNRDKNEEDLFVDELLTRECPSLKLLWERGRDGPFELSIGGNYPPSTLYSLLGSYVENCHNVDSNELENKHQITLYFLMDLAMLLQDFCPGAKERLGAYRSAFKLSPSLVSLTEAFWRLDHGDYQGFLDAMTGQLVSDSDVKDWHHKLVLRALIRNNEKKLALTYLRVRKPPLSSLEDQGIVISLSVEHGLVQSAFHRRPPSHYAQLLTRFFQACKQYGKLNDILHLALDSEEEEAFVKFLEDEKSEDTRLLYYLQRCRYAEASSVYPSGGPSGRGNFQKYNKPASLTMFNAYNATLPEITKKFSSRMNRRGIEVDPDSRYPRPMSHRKNRGAIRELHETVIRKAKETFVRCDRSQIPFISAPCASLRSGPSNVDTNCVLFVQKAKKPYGKRSLDEMRAGGDDATNNDNDGEERKRRKTSDANDGNSKVESKELGMSMVFDTPHKKRKNDMMSARGTPVETPHSILKIRQFIRDSTSPSLVERAAIEVKERATIEKEKKPRQIRFSIDQRRVEDSMKEASGSEDENNAEPGDINEDSNETEKSLSKCEASEDEESEEAFFSPNVSSKSYSDTTLLSDSSYASRNVSGPRPRPSLRRSNFSCDDSSSDLRRRSLMKSSDASMRSLGTPLILDSSKAPGDSTTYDDDDVKKRDGSPVFSTTIYEESILSSDTSFERSSAVIYRTDSSPTTASMNSFAERTLEKNRDSSEISGARMKLEQSSTFGRSVAVRVATRTSTTEEYSRDGENDKNSEILMEVDGFGLDRDSESRSRADGESIWEFDKFADRRASCGFSSTQIFPVPEVSETEENSRETQEDDRRMEETEDESRPSEQRDLGDAWPERKVSPSKREIEETEVNEDYDDELLALKYDEDEDPEEAFQSLTNSLDVDRSSAKLSSERSTTNEDSKKKLIPNNGFYEEPKIVPQEFTITDDESSRSVDGLAEAAFGDLDKTLSIGKLEAEIRDDVSNMTDDESEASRDSSIFSAARTRPSGISALEESKNPDTEKIVNDDDDSHDSSIFSSRNRKNNHSERNSAKEKNSPVDKSKSSPRNLAETRMSNDGKDSVRQEFSAEISPPRTNSRHPTRNSTIGCFTPKSSAQLQSSVVNVTPLRMTRSRRASSIVQDAPAEIESPAPKSRAEESVSRDDLSRAASTESESFPGRKPGRLQRSTSLAKEILPEIQPVRRSTRRAASVQKEIPESKVPSKLRTRSSSKTSVTEDEEQPDVPATKRKTRSTRGNSASKDSDAVVAPRRLTRASSQVKDIPEEIKEIPEPATKRNTRKRGNSVPKEIPLETSSRGSSQRTRRGASVTKEIIKEESNESLDESNRISSTGRPNEAASPSSSTRTRLASFTSIPEEEDDDDDAEIFSAAPRAKAAAKDRKTATTSRERRAVSVDPPLAEVKRRTRAAVVKSTISEEPIEEENSDSGSSAASRSKASKKPSARRKRAVSEASDKDDEVFSSVTKVPQRRARKLSQKSNDSTESYKFSPPDQDRPDDQQIEAEKVPHYLFSPPHTRSKHPATNQHRRKLSAFIEVTEEERKAADAPFDICARKRRICSTSELSQKLPPCWFFGPRKTFRLQLKRAKSTSD